MEKIIGYIVDVMYEEWSMADGSVLPVARVTLFSRKWSGLNEFEKPESIESYIKKGIVEDGENPEIYSEIEELKFYEFNEGECKDAFLWYNANSQKLLNIDFEKPVFIRYFRCFDDYKFFKHIVSIDNIGDEKIVKLG